MFSAVYAFSSSADEFTFEMDRRDVVEGKSTLGIPMPPRNQKFSIKTGKQTQKHHIVLN